MYIIVDDKAKNIVGVTSDEDPFLFMDKTTGSSFESKSFTIKEDIYFKLRNKGILSFTSKVNPNFSTKHEYYIIDPDPDPNNKTRDSHWEYSVTSLTGYDPIELKREAKIEIINN